MKRKIKPNKYLLIGVFAVIYLILINLIIGFDFNSINLTNDSFSNQGSSEVVVGFSDSVSILVEKERWYGKIIENGEDKNFYVLNLFKLPIKTQGHSLIIYHLLASGLIIFLPHMIVRRYNRNGTLEMVD